MADDDLIVTISGPALSLLLYENARNPNQYGFLLGEIQVFVTKKVTDSERVVEHTQTRINIKSVVSHPLGCEPFFNTPGFLDKKCLREFLKQDIHKVVGWYHHRYDHKIALDSLRDRNLHTDLSEYFSELNRLQKQENFIFFLLTATKNEVCGTHKFKHCLFRKVNKIYKPISFTINNLGVGASSPDGSDYKPFPKYTSCETDSFDKVYKSIRNDLQRVSGVEAVQLIEKSAEALLEKLIPKVNKIDKIIIELEFQLYTMRHKQYQERWERKFLELKMQQCSMDVETQPHAKFSSPSPAKSEPQSPESPLMFDPPKISPSSSDVKMATKKVLKQESSEEPMRHSKSSEREISQMIVESPRSPEEISSGEWKPVSQRKAEWLQRSNSSSESKNVRKSPEFGRNNS